ncbi:MAG TPA: class I SAM-dependent methyltransferase [Actinomycetota bacterium]|nr:class I SAM-dependent methyltransferase [Actinomycetota bacterium]
MAYFDWHGQPGYFRDITRHFDSKARMLDVGCGTGWLADHFAEYTGVDASPDAVKQALERGRNVLLADLAQPLPFEDGSFDAAVVKDVLEHVPDPVLTLREVHRVVKSGGLVFASSPDAQRWVWNDYTHRRPFTRRAFRLLFRDCGFEVEKLGYESVVPGTGRISALTRRKRRPRILQAAAWLPVVRRNVWILARRRAG